MSQTLSNGVFCEVFYNEDLLSRISKFFCRKHVVMIQRLNHGFSAVARAVLASAPAPASAFEVGKRYLYHSGWTMGRVNKYTIVKRTPRTAKLSCPNGGRSYKVHEKTCSTTGEKYESMHVGDYANHPVLDSRLFVGSDTPIAKAWDKFDTLNKTTDRLLDY
jgi:hypothetical protein